MRIKSIQTNIGPFKNGLPLLPKGLQAQSPANYTTVLIGANGTSKSLALRLLTDACLGIAKYESDGHPVITTTVNYQSENTPGKVIAISGTPLDRFPRGGRPGPTSMFTAHDKRPFIYIGQKAVNGMAGSKQSERSLAYLFLRNVARLPEASAEISAVFNRFDLPTTVWIRFNLTKGVSTIDELIVAVQEASSERRLMRASETTSDYAAALQFGTRILEDYDFAGEVFSKLLALQQVPWASPLSVTQPRPVDGRNPSHDVSNAKSFYYLALLRIIQFRDIAFDAQTPQSRGRAPTENAIFGEDLSSGQWHWLSSMCGVALEAEDECAILIDEPENSLHPSWQRDYLPALHVMLARRTGCHVVVATHSALVASSISSVSGCVLGLKRNGAGQHPVVTSSLLEATYGWNATDVLEEVFSMSSTRAPEFSRVADQALGLIADGKEKHAPKLAELVDEISELMLQLPAHDPMRRVFISIIDEVKAPSNEGDA
ncbi:AAA family ATPase [Paraburkholderia sp. A3BS-1L]|uniref:AAA family ATPase n=1 Tax=Paraburkholderia sp. A3BS-1L TaxID=3028375 RepID=UPI003DA935AC